MSLHPIWILNSNQRCLKDELNGTIVAVYILYLLILDK